MNALFFIGSANTTSVGCVWTTGAATTLQLVATLSKSLLVNDFCLAIIECVVVSSWGEGGRVREREGGRERKRERGRV